MTPRRVLAALLLASGLVLGDCGGGGGNAKPPAAPATSATSNPTVPTDDPVSRARGAVDQLNQQQKQAEQQAGSDAP